MINNPIPPAPGSTAEHRSREVIRRIAGYILVGLLALAISVGLELAADWDTWEIVQSLGAAGAILILSMVRGSARKEKRDRLWITALGRFLTDLLVALITRLHAQDEEEKREEEKKAKQKERERESGEEESRRGGVEAEKSDPPQASPPDREEKEATPKKAVARDGGWERGENDVLWLPTRPASTSPRRERPPPQGD